MALLLYHDPSPFLILVHLFHYAAVPTLVHSLEVSWVEMVQEVLGRPLVPLSPNNVACKVADTYAILRPSTFSMRRNYRLPKVSRGVEPMGFKPLTFAVQRRRDGLLKLSGDCKTAANKRISTLSLFLKIQRLYSGCCTVAAQVGYGRRVASAPLSSGNLQRGHCCFRSAQGHLTY
jgi:hypothetical protein